MKKRTCKLLSALLCFAMLLTLLPVTALAEGTAGETMRFCSGILENSGATKYVVYARYDGTVYVMGQQSGDVWTAVEATDQYDQWFEFETPTSQITTFTVETGEPQTVKGTYNYQWHVFSFTPFYLKTGSQYLTAQPGSLTLGDTAAKTHWLTSWYDHWNVGYWTDDLIHYTTYAADNTRIVLDVSESEPRFTCATATDAEHISCGMAYQICRHENEQGEIALTSHAEIPATCTENGTEAYLSCGTCGAKYDPADTEGYRELTDAELIILSTGTEHSDVGGDGTCDICGQHMPSHVYAPAPAGDLTIGNKYLLVTKIGSTLYALAKPASNDTSDFPSPTSAVITPQTGGTVDFTDAYDAGALQITIGGGNEVWGAADVYTLEVTAKGMESGILSSTMGGNFSASVGVDKYGWRAKVTGSNGTAIIASVYGSNWAESLTDADMYYRAYDTGSGVIFSTTSYDTTSGYTEYPVYLYLMNTSEGEEEEHTTHTWDNGVITTQPTCVDTGVMTYTCTVCGETKTEGIDALGHTYGDWVYAGESQHKHICITCGHTETEACALATGYDYDSTNHWQTCSVCGGIVDKAAHSMTDWEDNTQVENVQYRYCSTCGYNETRVKEITDATALVQGESIVINVSGTADTASTTLSAGTVNVLAAAVSDNNVPANSVTIELNSTTSVSYDAAAVSAINNAVGNAEENTTTVTLVVENNPNLDCGMDAGMTPEQQATIIDAAGAAAYDTDDQTIPDANTTSVTVYSITLEVTTGTGETATTTEISDFGDGTATVTVPYHEPVGEGETVSVVRVETNGTTTEMPSDYDADDQTVTWTTGSHSFYMITSGTASAPDPTPMPDPIPDPGTGGGYVPVTNGVTAEKAEHGSVTVSPVNAAAGTTVTVTVAPDKGYTLETLTVTDAGGREVALTAQGDGKYTFKMPSSKVTVKATFMDDNTMLNFFTDVQADDYFYDAILWAAKNGITDGTSATTFSPNANCTRGQIVTFLWRAAGCPAPKSSENPFTDVSSGAFYYDAMLWAVENGITNGTGDGTTFSPNLTCTRDQAVTFLWRSAGKSAAAADMAFTDVSADAYYAPAVQWAVTNGITTGTGDGSTFSPADACTRGQIVAFLYRWLVE